MFHRTVRFLSVRQKKTLQLLAQRLSDHQRSDCRILRHFMHMNPANAGKPHMTVVKYDNPPVKDCFGVDSELCLLEAGKSGS